MLRSIHGTALGVVLFWSTGIRAQVVHLAVPEGYVVAGVAKEQVTRNQHPERWYYWVRAQQLFSTQGGAAGTPLHGSFTAYHPTGQLREKGKFGMGLKHGVWNAWDQAGRLRSVEHWRYGQLHGNVRRFDGTGALLEEHVYRHGQVRSPRPERVRCVKPTAEERATANKESKAKPGKVKKERAVKNAKAPGSEQEERKAKEPKVPRKRDSKEPGS